MQLHPLNVYISGLFNYTNACVSENALTQTYYLAVHQEEGAVYQEGGGTHQHSPTRRRLRYPPTVYQE